MLRVDSGRGFPGRRNKVQTLRKTPEDADAEDFRACVEHFVQCGWSEADFEGSTVEGADAHMAALLSRVATAASSASTAGAAKCVINSQRPQHHARCLVD